MRHLRLISGGLVLVLAAVLGLLAWNTPVGKSSAAVAQISREPGGDAAVTVTVTRAEERILDQPGNGPDLSGMKGRVLPFAVSLDTHQGDLSKLDLNGRLFLRDSTGMEIPGMARQTAEASHHTTYTVAFPKLDSKGKPIDDPSQKRITMLIRGVGQTQERELTWELGESSRARPWILGLAAFAALGLAAWLIAGYQPTNARSRWITVTSLVALSLLLAGGWLVVAQLAGKSGMKDAVATRKNAQATATEVATRTGFTESGNKVQVTYGSPEYYQRTGQVETGKKVEAESHLVFVITEEHHDGSSKPVVPVLLADGVEIRAPAREQVLVESEHHRTRIVRFARTDTQGTPYIGKDVHVLELKWPGMRPEHDANHVEVSPLRWSLPLQFPVAEEQTPLSPLLFLTLTAGLFAALSPCLIQLTVYYLSILAGVSVSQDPGNTRPQWPVVRTALWFVAGVIIAYTAGGALAGVVGRSLQEVGLLGGWNRPVAILTGLAIVILGIYTGAAARAPMLCKLPLPKLTRFAQGKGGPGTMVMGAAVAFGCLQCFGGAIYASLLFYVGSLGSPALGAGMLFLFSVGVSVPFLLAALAWSRVAPHLARLERATPYVALLSSLIMITLGLLMVADRFHWVSGMIMRVAPWLKS